MPHTDKSSQRSAKHGSQKQERPKQTKLVPSRHRQETEVDPMVLWEKRRIQLARERKILTAMTVLCCLATAIWIAALSTDYWIVVDLVPRNATNGSETVLKSHIGVWRGCKRNREESETVSLLGRLTGDGCTYHSLQQDDLKELKTLPSVAGTIVDYRRTIVSLAGLSLLCHIMADSFAIYTFRNGRYTFKRLAGCMHLMTAATVFVLIEVVTNGTDYAKSHLISYHPVGSVWYHGFSFYLAWIVVTQFGVAGLVFLILSKKKKSLNIVGEDGNYLPDDDS